MDNKIFRKKNLDRISSPENLDAFLRVTNPSMWMAFAAILFLLAGALGWAFFGTIESKANGVIVSKDNETVCYVSEKKITEIKVGMTVRVGSESYTITEISENAVLNHSVLSDYAIRLGGFQDGEYVYALKLDRPLEPGNYQCEVVLEVIHPVEFLG